MELAEFESTLLKCFDPLAAYSRQALIELSGVAEVTKLSRALGVLKNEDLIQKCPEEKTWSLTTKGKAHTYFNNVTEEKPAVTVITESCKSNIEPISAARKQKAADPLSDAIHNTTQQLMAIGRKPSRIKDKIFTLGELGKYLDPTIDSLFNEIADDLKQLEAITGAHSESGRV